MLIYLQELTEFGIIVIPLIEDLLSQDCKQNVLYYSQCSRSVGPSAWVSIYMMEYLSAC